MRLLLFMALAAVAGCASPLRPSPVGDLPLSQPQTLPAPVAPQPPPRAVEGASCTPTIPVDFPISNQAEKVAWMIIELKRQLREVSVVDFHLREADSTPRDIIGHYTEVPVSGQGRVLDFVTVPGFQSVDRREIAAGLMRWSTGVSFDIAIKGVPIVECLPESYPVWLQVDLQ